MPSPRPHLQLGRPDLGGARWIRTFFNERLAAVPRKMLLLDWHHLAQKCRGREAKRGFLRRLLRRKYSKTRGNVASVQQGTADAGPKPRRNSS